MISGFKIAITVTVSIFFYFLAQILTCISNIYFMSSNFTFLQFISSPFFFPHLCLCSSYQVIALSTVYIIAVHIQSFFFPQFVSIFAVHIQSFLFPQFISLQFISSHFTFHSSYCVISSFIKVQSFLHGPCAKL